MARRRHRTNPFYILLVATGIAFTVTACAYFVLALRGSGGLPGRATAAGESPQVLLDFLHRHGVRLIVGELVLLAAATCGAIGTDSWWSGEASDRQSGDTTDSHRRQP